MKIVSLLFTFFGSGMLVRITHFAFQFCSLSQVLSEEGRWFTASLNIYRNAYVHLLFLLP